MSGISKNGDFTGWSDGVFTKVSDSWVGTGSFTVQFGPGFIKTKENFFTQGQDKHSFTEQRLPVLYGSSKGRNKTGLDFQNKRNRGKSQDYKLKLCNWTKDSLSQQEKFGEQDFLTDWEQSRTGEGFC